MQRTLILGTLFAASLLAACGPHYVAAGFGPPPPPRYGVMGYAPGPGYIWAEGYWDRGGSGWTWVGGRWMLPPRGRTVWVRPEWRQESGHWRYRRGYWR